MDTPTDFEDPYPYFGRTVPEFPVSEAEPEVKEIEMAKKEKVEVCPQCGSDNLYLDSLMKKEWGYDAAILGDREFEKPFTRVTCLACGHSYDKFE